MFTNHHTSTYNISYKSILNIAIDGRPGLLFILYGKYVTYKNYYEYGAIQNLRRDMSTFLYPVHHTTKNYVNCLHVNVIIRSSCI